MEVVEWWRWGGVGEVLEVVETAWSSRRAPCPEGAAEVLPRVAVRTRRYGVVRGC